MCYDIFDNASRCRADGKGLSVILQMSAAFQPIAPGDGFEFDPDSVLDCNHGSCLHFKSRQGRAELVNGQRIVAVHQ